MQAKWNSWKENIGRYRHVPPFRKSTIIVVSAALLVAASLLVTAPSHATLFGTKQAAVVSSTVSASSAAASGTAVYGPTAASGQRGASSGVPESSTSASAATPATFLSAGGRLVIETADVRLTVSNVVEMGNKVSSVTKERGGFVQSMNQSTESHDQNVETMILRVPESQFQSVLTTVKSYGTVESFSQTGQDVTSQNNNLQQQLSELDQEATAYSSLFAKATTMADMLQIQQSLTQVNSEISNLNGQLHQLDRSVEYATINVTLQPAAVRANATKTPLWSLSLRSLGFMGRVGVGLAKIAAWMLPWALLAGLLYAGVRVWKRGRAKKGGSR